MIDTTICALFYGDYPELAKRCLSSIVESVSPERVELRLGFNRVSGRTFAACKEIVQPFPSKGLRYDVFLFPDMQFKYPRMRQMLHGSEKHQRIETRYTIWFDDDSFVEPGNRGWLDGCLQQLETADMVGLPRMIRWQGRQREWVAAQPWYKGKDPAKRSHVHFLNGAFWATKTDLLREVDYPWPELNHCGGDVMLGECFRQQGLKQAPWYDGIAINADMDGRTDKSKRRGHGERPIGFAGPTTKEST